MIESVFVNYKSKIKRCKHIHTNTNALCAFTGKSGGSAIEREKGRKRDTKMPQTGAAK